MFYYPVLSIFDFDKKKIFVYNGDLELNNEGDNSYRYRGIPENTSPVLIMDFIPLNEMKRTIKMFKNFFIIPHMSNLDKFITFKFLDKEYNSKLNLTPAFMYHLNDLKVNTLFGEVIPNNKINLLKTILSVFDISFYSKHLVNKEISFHLIGERKLRISFKSFKVDPVFCKEIIYKTKKSSTESEIEYLIQQNNVKVQELYLRLFEKMVIEYYRNPKLFYKKVKEYIDENIEIVDWFEEKELY